MADDRTMSMTDGFVNCIYDFAQNGITGGVIEKAGKHLADYIAVTVGGYAVNSRIMEEYAGGSRGTFHVIGCGRKADLNTAVLINAFNAHTLELDDGHRNAMMHLGAPIFSGLIAVAEKEDLTVRDVLRGAAAGYEAAVRMGAAIQPSHKKKGFHGTGTCGVIGTALGIAVMRGYSREEMKNVLSAAAASGAGLLETTAGHSEQKPYNAAHAASAGVSAALFGRYFQGPEDVLGGPRGFISCFSDTAAVDELTKKYEMPAIFGTYMKPYAACRHCHAPIEAVLKLRAENKIDIDKIEEIVVSTYEMAVYGHDACAVSSPSAAKMSTPYSVAAALLYGQAGLEAFADDKISDLRTKTLAEKVRVQASEELSAVMRQKRAAVVEIHFQDGTVLQERVDYPKGEPENPMSDKEVTEKFYSLVMSAGYDTAYCDRLLAFIRENEQAQLRGLLAVMEGERR